VLLVLLQSSELTRDKVLIEDELHRLIAHEESSIGPLVFQCMNYAVFPGGKRLRPLLGMRIASAFGADTTACVTHVAVVELIHSASLILDDLPCMDNAAFRRSLPAAHVQFGEAAAILAAFALVILGIRTGQTKSQDSCAPAVIEFRRMLLDSIGRRGLITGQEIDLTSRRSGQAGMRNHWKTAPLFELACAAGLVCSDLPTEVRSWVLGFGRSYGSAFQSIDDMLDEEHIDMCRITRELSSCTAYLGQLKLRDEEFRQLNYFVECLRSFMLTPAQIRGGSS
jgi:geranylgeranyl diphosphate synthase type II